MAASSSTPTVSGLNRMTIHIIKATKPAFLRVSDCLKKTSEKNTRLPVFNVKSLLLFPAAAALLNVGAAFNAYAATAAGTEIKNLATVSYEDAAGNSYTAQSNEAIVTVAQVYSASINSTDTNLSASAGQPVDISYTLENTGNGTDNYTFTAADGIIGGDDLDADNITVFEDLNNNGQADSGEPTVSELTLTAEEIKSIVVRVDVPNNVITGDTLGITLSVNALEGTGTPVANSVLDVTPGKGPDSLDSTIESLITITGDAVIVTRIDSVHDRANNRITYTVSIKNNGNSDAESVLMRNAIPENTTYVSGSATTNGLLSSNGDTPPAPTLLDEAADGIDYNGDGDTTDSLPGIRGNDAVLPSNASTTITYTVDYDPAVVPGGTIISNIAYITADVDADASTPAVTISTNEVNDTLGDTLMVSITDTAEATGGDGINDGRDDDGANDIQLVDQASAGDAVLFKHVVTNIGNTDDVLELAAQNTSFPAGTIFTFWNETKTVQLADTNGQNGVDIGLMAPGESKTITVLVNLPAGFSGAGNFDAVVTVSSNTDVNMKDTVAIRLALINASTIDIHNNPGGIASIDDNPIGTPDYAAVDTSTTDIGTTVTIPLYIDNDDDANNSYLLNAGSIYNAATNTVDGLPTGWFVQFFEADASGDPVGNAITTTPVIPGKTLDYQIIAVVTVPASQDKAADNFIIDNDADGLAETLDGNGDGDGDYPIFFQISSTNTGASDVTLEAIDVNSVISVSLTPNGFTQIDPGGTETYQNTLVNNGNATETYELSYSHSRPDWTSTLSIDTDGDGVADTVLENLTAGAIQVRQPDGNTATVDISLGAGNVPQFTLDSGEAVSLDATVFAPVNAPSGEIDALTITATNTVSGGTATAQNQSQIVSGKVRISKAAALDTDCNGTADTPFTARQPETVEPGECVIWRITAENQGSEKAFNVQIRDAAPSFTSFVPGSLSYCLNQNCTLGSVTDSVSDDAGEENAGDVVFYVGTGATPSSGIGGELVSGNQATVQFSVSID